MVSDSHFKMDQDSLDSWDVCDLSLDDSVASPSFQLVSDEHDTSPADDIPSSGLPVPALHHSVGGSTFFITISVEFSPCDS